MRGTSVKRTSHWPTGRNNNVVPFDTPEYDDDGLWSAAEPTRLGPMPAPLPGERVVIYATGIWSAAASGYRELKVFRNGNADEPVAVVQVAKADGNVGVELTSRPLPFAEGDWFELVGRSANPSTLLYAEDYSITFSIEVRD